MASSESEAGVEVVHSTHVLFFVLGRVLVSGPRPKERISPSKGRIFPSVRMGLCAMSFFRVFGVLVLSQNISDPRPVQTTSTPRPDPSKARPEFVQARPDRPHPVQTPSRPPSRGCPDPVQTASRPRPHPSGPHPKVVQSPKLEPRPEPVQTLSRAPVQTVSMCLPVLTIHMLFI